MSDIQHKILFVCIHNSTVASWPKPSLKNTVVNTFLWKDEFKRLNWSFTDPSAFTGAPEEILRRTREVRDEIETKIKAFAREANTLQYWM